MFSARATMTAALSRAFMSGSGRPSLAATVISRASLEKSLERIASCLPFLCMMFLNWLWPAIDCLDGCLNFRGMGWDEIGLLYAAPGAEGRRPRAAGDHAAHRPRHRAGGRPFPRFSRPRRPGGALRRGDGDP